ncbi:hypothetical protein AB0407_04855 [Streptomyces microflavus]
MADRHPAGENTPARRDLTEAQRAGLRLVVAAWSEPDTFVTCSD